MGIVSESFGWLSNIGKKPIDQIDVGKLEEKMRAMERLRTSWEREIKTSELEYKQCVSVEENAHRSPMSRKLALKKGRILAEKIKRLVSASAMLGQMKSAVEQLKMMKKFYQDMTEASILPRGMSLQEALKQIYAMGDAVEGQKEKMKDLIGAIESFNITDSKNPQDETIVAAMEDINKLYDEYNEKIAMNDTAGANEIKIKIEAKQAEVDKCADMEELA